jgi:hypothetical protein
MEKPLTEGDATEEVAVNVNSRLGARRLYIDDATRDEADDGLQAAAGREQRHDPYKGPFKLR